MFDEFNEIEEFQPKTAYKIPPGFGITFIWYDKVRQSSYRAFRLNTSSADAQSIKFFLFDIGEIKYKKFSRGSFFHIPLKFLRLPPFGLCCIVDKFPAPHEDCLRMEYFTDSRIGKSYNITITRKGMLVNSIGADEKCLVVNLEDFGDESDDEPLELPALKTSPSDVDHFRELTYLSDSAGQHIPFLYNQIPKIEDWPQPGSKIMVFITAIGTRCVHASCNTQNSYSDETLREFMSLMMWMNQSEVIMKYKKFDVPPIKDEVVMVMDKSYRFRRAVVMNVFPGCFYQVSCTSSTDHSSHSSFQIFLFDVGKNMTTHQNNLFKFPKEFGTMPAQAIRLRIAGLDKMSDDVRVDVIATIHLYCDSIRMAHVM